MKTVYLVRHGEAEHNIPGEIYLNGPGSRLTDRGIEQSKFIAKRAAKLPIESLIASPFERTRKTAEYIAEETGLAVELSELFTEVSPPSTLVGRRMDDAERRQIADAWEPTIFNTDKVLDGDNFTDVTERARRARVFLEERPEKHIMVVTHGLFMRFLIGEILFGAAFGPDIARRISRGFRTINTGVTILKHDPDDTDAAWWVYVWNDHAHLAE